MFAYTSSLDAAYTRKPKLPLEVLRTAAGANLK